MEFKSDVNEDVLLSEAVRGSVGDWSKDISSDQQFDVTVQEHERSTKKKIVFILVFVVIAFIAVIYALQGGSLTGNAKECLQILWDKLWGNADTSNTTVYWTLYATPPILGSVIGGAGLAICGAVMQSVLRNPMADPYTTGISSGASFGAALALASSAALMSTTEMRVVLAFVFAMIPVLVILAMTKFTNASPVTIIMTGIGVMYVFNALTSFVKLKAGSIVSTALDNWLMGDASLVQWESLPYMTVIVVAGIIITMYLSSRINVLATGDDNAKAMGVNADKLRIICMVVTAIVSAGVISFTGLIGFVGLVCPHIARMFVGADNRYLLPASAAIGGALMVVAYHIGKMIISPTLVPVGIIMSIIGGPVFIWLVIRKNKSSW